MQNQWYIRVIYHWLFALGVAGLFIQKVTPWIDILHEQTNFHYPYLLIIGWIISIIGFMGLFYSHPTKPGILINPRWISVLYDVILIVFGIGSALMVLTYFFSKINATLHHGSDDFIIFMGIYFYFIGLPIVVWYIHRFATQSIIIDQNGVQIFGSKDKQMILWKDLKFIQLKDELIWVRRVGTVIPRKLQDKLVFTDTHGNETIINEPQLKTTKKKILRTLKQHSPEYLKLKIGDLEREWL